MKKVLHLSFVSSLLIFSVNAKLIRDDLRVRTLDVEQLESPEMDDKDEENFFNAREINVTSDRIEEQKYLCKKYANDSYAVCIPPLKQLTDKRLIVTSKSLKDVEENPKSTLLHLDLYDGANSPILIYEALTNIWSKRDKSLGNSSDKDQESGQQKEPLVALYDAIQENEQLAKSLENLRSILSKLRDYGEINFEEKEYANLYSRLLNAFADILEIFDEAKPIGIVQNIKMSEEAKIARKKMIDFQKKHGYFVEFLKLSHKISNLMFVRYNTEKILSKTRAALEDIQNHTINAGTSTSIDIPTPIPGVSINAETFFSKLSQGTNALSFCSVTSTTGGKAGLTFNILPAKLSTNFNMEDASISLFYSLEAYMDYLNSNGKLSIDAIQAKLKGMGQVLSDRKSMQEKEQEALKYSGTFERYLKMFRALPNVGVSVNWITVTKAMAKDQASERTYGAEVEAGISLAEAAKFGISLHVSQGSKSYVKELPLLSMIDEDCRMSNGLPLQYLQNAIDNQSNSEKKVRKPMRDNPSDLKKQNDISDGLSDGLSVSPHDVREKVGTPNNLLGFLNSYVFALESLATVNSEEAIHRAENDKHNIEAIFVPEGKKGRNAVFQSAVLTACLFREEYPDDQENDLRFKKIYDQIVRLAKLCEFSKNNSGIRKVASSVGMIQNKLGYNEKTTNTASAKADVHSLQASFTAQVPYLGKTAATAMKKTFTGSPLITENGKYVSLKFSLPIASAGVMGTTAIKARFKTLFEEVSSKFNSLKDFAHVGKSAGANASALTVTQGIKGAKSVATSTAVTISKNASKVMINAVKGTKSVAKSAAKSASKIDSAQTAAKLTAAQTATKIGAVKLLSLPELIKDIKSAFNVEVRGQSEFNYTWKYVDPMPEGLKIVPLPGQKLITNQKGTWVLDFVSISTAVRVNNSYAGYQQKRTGANSLHDLTSKFNALSMGIADSKSADSTAIDSLFKGQSPSLIKMFKNIATMQSNAAFELQMMYNNLLSYCDNDEEKSEYEKLFADFIEACQYFSEETQNDEKSTFDENDHFDDISGDAEVADMLENLKDEEKPTSQQFKDTLNLFRKILEKQYSSVFKSHYDEAFQK